MATIRISDETAQEARAYGRVYNRTVPKQIEFWSKIGKVAEDNPDLTYDDIKGILLALEEEKVGLVEEYKFSS